ncbi:error-prone DNA polymerase [Chitinophaga sancti]|uniref:DNA polymerase III subunit alpha n=1 Tax=Chitinophaga sancti TaxID=1004 RepID=A0A1K1SSR9_9BACT|nr:error-prone DNA polymerase [Chitinophaga sancti]WQD65410.1 error-prone DNA polymerase [Chitinophaga sancti]WQG88967.1 error-prone DNA polymerase [Chitinophaga sancti]SFW87361.1 error-prone DNA polymerase [Chitinophaga sancti]
MSYAELQTTSNFSFLRGASHPEELVFRAAELGYAAIALTDRNTLAGIVRAHVAAKAKGIKFIPACRLDLQDGPSLLAYPTDKEDYERLSGLLSLGNLRTEKGKCLLFKADVYACGGRILYVLIPPEKLNEDFEFDPAFTSGMREYQEKLGRRLYIAANRLYTGQDVKRLFRINETGIPMVASNDVYYHEHERRELQDVLTCVREKCTIFTAGYRLHQNAERFLKPVDEMERLFLQYSHALERTLEIAGACTFSLSDLKYVYPEEICSPGKTPYQELKELTWKGARERYGKQVPEKVRDLLEKELQFIEKQQYENYFLTVYDYVREARDRGILCQGRGSAANSAVCYCLGITSVDPMKFKLLFARFMSEARNEPPDIDVDFEHERREEIIQYIYNKYGRNRAAIVATVTQQRRKGAIRDVGKAMGLSKDTIDRLSGAIWDSPDGFEEQRIAEQGLNPSEPALLKVLQLTSQMMGFPRQLGQHTGGFIITSGKLSDLCPILNARMEDRTNIEWNKDDIEALGFLKVDVLALGMLTCIRKAFDLVEKHYELHLTLANIPQDDVKVYDMISAADTIGVFQIESRAQMNMLPRMKPTCFYDLVIEVAIVRPGPIQGNMVHPYLKRRTGEETIEYPSKELEEILGRTLGVPLFQEQAMEIAIVAAGFTPAEADLLRRSMATFKFKGLVSEFEKKLVTGMINNNYTEDFARRVFKQLEGFGSYGFPESHAASFALLVYVSSWLKCYYPDVFAAALLNSLPMGFYQPAQIVIDAEKHGVKVLQPDINYSAWDNTLEEKKERFHILRLGFRQIKGMREEDADTLIRGRGPGYKNINSMMSAGLGLAALEKLADADAFRSIGMDRRKALWEVSSLHDRPMALFEGQPSESCREEQISLPFMKESEHVVHDYATTGLSVKAHPVTFIREQLSLLHILSTQAVKEENEGKYVKVAGLVLVRQRPGTAKGVCFITIEDETGFCNLVVFANLFDRFRKEILRSKLLMAEGRIQKQDNVVHLIVEKCSDLTGLLRKLTADERDPAVSTPSRADEKGGSFIAVNHSVRDGENSSGQSIPKARDFR